MLLHLNFSRNDDLSDPCNCPDRSGKRTVTTGQGEDDGPDTRDGGSSSSTSGSSSSSGSGSDDGKGKDGGDICVSEMADCQVRPLLGDLFLRFCSGGELASGLASLSRWVGRRPRCCPECRRSSQFQRRSVQMAHLKISPETTIVVMTVKWRHAGLPVPSTTSTLSRVLTALVGLARRSCTRA